VKSSLRKHIQIIDYKIRQSPLTLEKLVANTALYESVSKRFITRL